MQNTPKQDTFHIKVAHTLELFRLVRGHDEEKFLDYLSKLRPDDVDVNMRDENGNYLIFLAVVANLDRILSRLVDYGAQLDVLDADGYSILYYPIRYDYRNIIDLLIQLNRRALGISILNIQDYWGNVPIFYAIKKRNYYALEELVKNGANVNYADNEHMTVLHLAAIRGNVAMVKLLAPLMGNINAITRTGTTALHYASNLGHLEVVKLLVEQGARQNMAETDHDFLPIFYAVVQNNIDITGYLLDHSPMIGHQDHYGNTIVHYAIIEGHEAILDMILDRAKIARPESYYSEDINRVVDPYMLDVNAVNLDGYSIAHLLLYYYRENYLKYLKKILPYARLNYQDNRGNTVLHLVARKHLWRELSEILIQKRMNIYVKNHRERMVLDLIKVQEHDMVLDIVTQSYFNILKKHPGDWNNVWENQCSQKDFPECWKTIRLQILKNQRSVPIRRHKPEIQLMVDEPVKFTLYSGSLLDVIVGFKYLTRQHPAATIILDPADRVHLELEKYISSLGIMENPNQHLVHFEIKWIYQHIFFPSSLEKHFIEFYQEKKHNYLIIPISIILSNGNHSNSLIFDLKENRLERFEPHGSNYPIGFNYNPDLLDQMILQKFRDLVYSAGGSGPRYLRPRDYLPRIGFQILESREILTNRNLGDPNGFCSLWVIWYLDYRLRYPDFWPGTLARKLIDVVQKNGYSFRDIIRNYSKRITEYRDTMLEGIHRDINDYINNRLDREELDGLLQILLS